MESKNLDKAIEIYSKLISGEEICKKHPDNGPLYDEFYGNAEVYDIVMNMMKKMKYQENMKNIELIMRCRKVPEKAIILVKKRIRL